MNEESCPTIKWQKTKRSADRARASRVDVTALSVTFATATSASRASEKNIMTTEICGTLAAAQSGNAIYEKATRHQAQPLFHQQYCSYPVSLHTF